MTETYIYTGLSIFCLGVACACVYMGLTEDDKQNRALKIIAAILWFINAFLNFYIATIV